MEDKLNPTCLISGKTSDLLMYAHRDENGNMVGWYFLHKDIDRKTINFKINIDYPKITLEASSKLSIQDVIASYMTDTNGRVDSFSLASTIKDYLSKVL